MKKTLLTGLIWSFVLLLHAQNFQITPGPSEGEKLHRMHESFLGEDASLFYVLETRRDKPVSMRPRMIMSIRAYDKVSMKMKKELVLEDMYELNQFDEKVFLGARILGEQIAMVWDNPKKKQTKITWVSLKTLTRSKKETLLFEFDEKYQSRYDLLTLMKSKPSYGIRLDPSKDETTLLVSSLEVDPDKGSKFTVKRVINPNAKPETVGTVSTSTNLQELAFTWKVLKGKTGSAGIYLHVPQRKNAEYKKLEPGLYVAAINSSNKKGEFQLLAAREEEHPRWRYLEEDGLLYLAGANLRQKTPDFFVAILDIDNIASFEINSTVFPAEAHAQLRSVDDYEKYLEKATEGKSYFSKDLELGAISLSKDKDILFSISEQPRSLPGDEDPNWQYGDILIGSVSTTGKINWTKAMKRKIKEKYPDCFPIPYYVHEVVSTEHGFVILVTQPLEKLDGLDLKTKGAPSKEDMSIVFIKEDGSWTKESPNLDKKYRNLKAIPYASHILSNGNIVYAARIPGNQTYIQLMMND